jgi:hypothetical protein
MKTKTLACSLLGAALMLTASCSTTHAKTPTPGILDPAITVKILRAQADTIEKQNDPSTKLGELSNLGNAVNAGVEQAQNDCKSKGFMVDGKGKGMLNVNGLMISCVPKPPAAAK